MTKVTPSTRRFGLPDLARLVLWGLSAATAFCIAVYAGFTDVGQQRFRTSVADFYDSVTAQNTPAIVPFDARDGRRLAETVGAINADRQRLATRVDTLEHRIEDITGSIAREKAARDAAPPEPAPLPPLASAPPTAAPAPQQPSPAQDDVTASIPEPAVLPAAPTPPKTEYGLDLGSAPSVEALRTAWGLALRRHAAALTGLQPLVQKRDRPRPEFRLIAGPLPNAAAAARLCATMTAAGSICAPAVFDGQRLAVR